MKLILINGAPATGKTTLAVTIAHETGIASLGKDQVKEFLFDTLGVGDREWSRALGRATNDFLYIVADNVLASGKSLIIENAFEKSFAKTKIEQLAEKYSADCFEVYCFAEGLVRRQRFIDRQESGQRHAGHVDDQNFSTADQEEDVRQKYAPIGVGKVIEVDTTDVEKIDIPRIIAALQD